MEREDARKLSPEQQMEKRKIGLRMRMNGREFSEIEEAIGVLPRTLQYRWHRYQAEDSKAVTEEHQRGNEAGKMRALTAQEWMIRTVGEYLKCRGFTPQNPLKRAHEQKPEWVDTWLKEGYALIAKRAKAESENILWEVEAGVHNDCQHVRSHAPAGEAQIQRAPGSRFSTDMISTVNNQGELLFMIFRETLTAPVLLRFLARLVRVLVVKCSLSSTSCEYIAARRCGGGRICILT